MSMLVVMTVYDGKSEDDKILNQRVINYLDRERRVMLAKTGMWAMHHGHELVIRRLDPNERVDVINTQHEATA